MQDSNPDLVEGLREDRGKEKRKCTTPDPHSGKSSITTLPGMWKKQKYTLINSSHQSEGVGPAARPP